MTIAALFAEIAERHTHTPPLPETLRRELEDALPHPLPADLREFYGLCNGATLFEDESYTFVPLEEIKRVRADLFGEDRDEDGMATWYSVCDVWDGNYVAADLATAQGADCQMLDIFHEAPVPARIIARSFTEFLERALHSGGEHYWLAPDFTGYGQVPGPG